MASLARTNSQPTSGACTTDKGSPATSLALFNRLQLRPSPNHLGLAALLPISSRDRGTATVPQEHCKGYAGEDRMGHLDKGGHQNVQVFYARMTGASHSLNYSQSCYFAISITPVRFLSNHPWERYSADGRWLILGYWNTLL